MYQRFINSQIKKYFRSFYIVCFVSCLLSTTPVFAQVSLFVDAPTTEDQKSATWVEGLWLNELGQKCRDTESLLGGYPPQHLENIKKAKVALAAGKKLLDALEPEKALKKCQQSIQLFESASLYLSDLTPLSNAWLCVGLSHLTQGKKAAGEKAFLQAIVYVPNVNIRKMSSDQDKLVAFQKAKAAWKKLKKSTVKVRSTPTASIFVNGKFVGVSPQTLSLQQGQQIIVVQKEGYRRSGRLLNVGSSAQSFTTPLAVLPPRANWLQTGSLAAQKLNDPGYPAAVSAFSTLTQSPKLLLATVRKVKGRVWIHAAVYDTKQQKKLASGGAWATAGKPAYIIMLFRELMAGRSPKINGWDPGKPPPMKRRRIIRKDPKSSGSNVGLIVGITVGTVVLAGAGVAAYFLFFNNSCSNDGACTEITFTQ